jgi:hypothetical protein
MHKRPFAAGCTSQERQGEIESTFQSQFIPTTTSGLLTADRAEGRDSQERKNSNQTPTTAALQTRNKHFLSAPLTTTPYRAEIAFIEFVCELYRTPSLPLERYFWYIGTANRVSFD